MPYDPDTGWSNWAREAEIGAREMLTCLVKFQEAYNEWQTFRASRTDAQIATAFGRTEAEVADLDACFSAFKEIYDFADNASPTAGDWLYAMRLFS